MFCSLGFLPLIGWAIAAGVTAIAGGIAAAVADDSSGSSSSSTRSDESARRREALNNEKINKEERAWTAFVAHVKEIDQRLKRESKEGGLGKVILSGLNGVRMEHQRDEELSAVISNVAQILRGKKSEFDDGDKIKPPHFRYTSIPPSKGAAHKRLIEQIDALLTGQVGGVLWDTNTLIDERGLDAATRKILCRVCSGVDLAELEDFLKEASELRPRLAAAGVLKAGKSTLMNCLTGDFSNQRFKTNVIRETTHEQVHEQDGYLFVDTPGVDANDHDTKVAEEALRLADVVLFAHNMNEGGLDAPERQFLESIQKNWDNASDFIEKAVVVLTHLDKKEDDRDLIEEDVCQQFAEIFGAQPQVVSVSSSRYMKGMLEDKPVMVKKSNYSSLNKVIGEKTLVASQQKRKRYQGKITQKAQHIKSVLLDARESQKEKLEVLEAEHKEKVKLFKKEIRSANEKITTAYKGYLRKIEQEEV